MPVATGNVHVALGDATPGNIMPGIVSPGRSTQLGGGSTLSPPVLPGVCSTNVRTVLGAVRSGVVVAVRLLAVSLKRPPAVTFDLNNLGETGVLGRLGLTLNLAGDGAGDEPRLSPSDDARASCGM